MQSDIALTLASLCLGMTLTGAVMALSVEAHRREQLCIGLVYGTFAVILSLPLTAAFTPAVYLFHVPLVLVMLFVLPPAVFHYVAAKAAPDPAPLIPRRDILLPAAATAVCLGFWVLPAAAKTTLFIAGDLPPGTVPATLALITFGLILCWHGTSLAYLVGSLRHLRRYRSHIRDHYSNLERRELRWVDAVMALLVILWWAAALSLATDNLANGPLFPPAVLYGLTACCLIIFTVFATRAPPPSEPEAPSDPPETKYAKSALTPDHATKLATRIEAAMRQDRLYLDPNLSLQKLSRHVGAPPNLVSQTLNEVIGSSFFDYVAHWRIEAAKPLLRTGDASVLTIALDVGFNSRSTFYKAFRRETGETPTAFQSNQN